MRELLFWLSVGAPPPAPFQTTLVEVITRLRGAGLPIDRAALFVRTLHPTVGGRAYFWTVEEGLRSNEAAHHFFATDDYRQSPAARVFESAAALRRRIGGNADDYAFFDEMAATGFTDYYGQPLIHMEGEVNAVSWSTRAPQGFSDDAIRALDLICPAFTRIVEIYLLKLNTVSVLSTYVGRNAGARVLDGRIQRGDHERLPSAILFADLVGFTALSNRLPPSEVLERLNAFFDALAEPIGREGGEILRFLGDGVLAIFPVASGAASREAAAEAALRTIEAARAADPGLDFRAALHVGEVYYGNVGSATRLDFTVIGPAVNLAARLLAEAGRLGLATVASADFAALVPGRCREAARAALKGFEGPQTIFAVG
ncbi:MAG TPA: adenylate/guanylate cyclase domain-containing protein [Paracoccaceae bacterium]|nr:adenylate/guanylate cyclase domain-containing protein [Paracoccaceae bacterium]